MTSRRTVRRVSRPLNRGKWEALTSLAKAYAEEKDGFLVTLASPKAFSEFRSHRELRDALLEVGYRSTVGLQARMWKLALQDAYETIAKQHAAVAADVRRLVYQREGAWSKEMQVFAYWLLKSPGRVAAVLAGRTPRPEKLDMEASEVRRVVGYLRRTIRKRMGRPPRAKLARSVCFDAEMYQLEEVGGRQTLALMTLTPRQRVNIPLLGRTSIQGTIRVVLDEDRRRVEVHETFELGKRPPLTGESAAIDAGITEVFVDDEGNSYGEGFGKVLLRYSEEVMRKGRRRNKLRGLEKKALRDGAVAKARRIRRNNLGRKKLRRQRRRRRLDIERRINEATNAFLRKRQPRAFAAESLDLRGKAQSRRMSRVVSMWARNALKERVDFKAWAGGSRRLAVNPAYTSQTCPVPTCGFVDAKNRQGDRFQCGHCGYARVSDQVAAKNLKARMGDPEIGCYTPVARVKAILLARFAANEAVARLEDAQALTVSGPTPETEVTTSSGRGGRRQSSSQGGRRRRAVGTTPVLGERVLPAAAGAFTT